MDSLKQIIQSLATKSNTVIQGVVISESPVNIQAVNDPKLIIYSPIIPREFTDYPVKTNLSQDLTIKNALKTGEKVYLLSFNSNKQYFVLGRVDYNGDEHL
jgi:hypothetical protein